ncbi:anthranilate phosphoribosyltransferase [Pseudomonas sp. B329]|uniref:anthranilate phosphoribosyltransferase n=1 Tax=Pseudomonas sp. B329 TaxID=1553459 RepID=UPI00249E478D|nr:anthranilate phosphoribosyltransferase [Pseudomonas sp. B329]MCK3860984.1 anthranilate phosphoribosyltransferase [Pseudomonas sp. B329]
MLTRVRDWKVPENVQLVVSRLIEGLPVCQEKMQCAFRTMMRGELPDSLVAALLVRLPTQHLTAAELTATTRVVREFLIPVNAKCAQPPIDLCGTGGDSQGTFNVSTTASFVAAAAGCYVAKHGNRSVSSSCGSADLLEAVGINLTLTPEQIALCLEQVGMGFMFTPLHRPALPGLNKVRKELAVRTVFNAMGPLTNPAGAKVQLVGVFGRELVPVMAQTLRALDSERALVVHGEDGLDEISLSGPTFVAELRSGQIREYTLHPHDLGLDTAPLDAIRVRSAEHAKAIFMGVLHNEAGPPRDIVMLNSAAALYLAGKVETLVEGVHMAAETLKTGKALGKYESLVAYTQSFLC